MTSKSTYTPQTGSLPSMVIGFFQNNPDEELTLEDIADKFGGARNNTHTNLSLAIQNGLLLRERNEDGDYIYKAGKKLSCAPKNAGVDIDAIHQGPKKAQKSVTATHRALDIDNLKVEEGIAFDPKGLRGRNKWQPLFDKLAKVGQSVAIPGEMYGALAAAARKVPKTQGVYRCCMTAPGQARIWRTA